ncbi:MAG: type VI secretion lipoprotein TssJ [Gammaproteobacteria bacterium]|nr:type VI secretion lipoprotein TssJ [Gammaproteobacteria bacterium]
MRFSFILFSIIIVSQLSLMGCQISPNISPSPLAESVDGASQIVLSAQKIPTSAAMTSSFRAIDASSTAVSTTSSSIGMVTDSLGSKSADATLDSAAKPPFSVGGVFSGLMVAVGLKDSPAEVAAKEQLKAAKDFAASQVPRSHSVIVEASTDANGDKEGHGFSTIFRFYALQDSATFNKIGLEEADSHNALPYQEELILPNHVTQIRVKYPSDSQFVVAQFQLHNRAHRWRLLIPVKRLQSDKPLRLALGRCDVRVKDGLLPMAPIASTQTTSSVKKPQTSSIEAELSSVCQ